MAVSHIGNKWLTFLFVIVTSTACKDFVAEPIPLSKNVQAALYDSTSVFFADFASYGELKSLPIGIFDADTTSMALLEAFESLDCYNNVTGEEEIDGISDFAGEYFQYYTSTSDNTCFESTMFLMKNNYWNSVNKDRSKIIIAGGNISSKNGLDDMIAVTENSGTGVKVITAVEAGVRAVFDELASDIGSDFTVAVLCKNSATASDAYSESFKKVATERNLSPKISLAVQPISITIVDSVQIVQKAIETLVDKLMADESKSQLKVLIMDGMDEELINAANEIFDKYRSTFINGTYPYSNILSDNILCINPSVCAAKECYQILRNDNNLALRITDQRVDYFYGI